MSAVKTSREAVERLCERMLDDCNSPAAALLARAAEMEDQDETR